MQTKGETTTQGVLEPALIERVNNCFELRDQIERHDSNSIADSGIAEVVRARSSTDTCKR